MTTQSIAMHRSFVSSNAFGKAAAAGEARRGKLLYKLLVVSLSLADVRRRSDLGDYSGQLQLETSLRITDRNNGPSETGTVQDVPYRVTVPCATTADSTIGSTCSVTTTADALGSGTVVEGRRAIWRLGQVRVNDGGADGVVAVQGVFVP